MRYENPKPYIYIQVYICSQPASQCGGIPVGTRKSPAGELGYTEKHLAAAANPGPITTGTLLRGPGGQASCPRWGSFLFILGTDAGGNKPEEEEGGAGPVVMGRMDGWNLDACGRRRMA